MLGKKISTATIQPYTKPLLAQCSSQEFTLQIHPTHKDFRVQPHSAASNKMNLLGTAWNGRLLMAISSTRPILKSAILAQAETSCSPSITLLDSRTTHTYLTIMSINPQTYHHQLLHGIPAQRSYRPSIRLSLVTTTNSATKSPSRHQLSQVTSLPPPKPSPCQTQTQLVASSTSQ